MQYPPDNQPYPQYPQQQPFQPTQPPPPAKKKRRLLWLWIIIGVFVVAASCAGLVQGIQGANTPASSPTPAQSQATSAPTAKPITPLAEHLTFHGDISGTLTSAINTQPLTHDNPIPNSIQQQDGTFFDPPPTATQCSDFDVSGAGRDYVAVIIGDVGAKRYAIAVEINEDDPAYTKPGTQLRPGNINSGGSVEVYETSGKNRRWLQVYGPAGQDAAIIVLHADRTSGTVDAWMATTDQSQKEAPATLHLQGNWRCG